MEYVQIEVPDMNDSLSRIVLMNTPYYIRFTYNDTEDYWKFGVYDSKQNPLVIGIKIVPQFPLNLFYGASKLPDGVFGVYTKKDRVGRNDFLDGTAKFVFIPNA